MGNKIASSLIQRLRSSSENTLMVSKTSAFPPVFTKDVFGVALASVSFNGFLRNGGGNPQARIPCTINKSTNIQGVSATNRIGEYFVRFLPGVFLPQDKYTIVGSVLVNSTVPASAANTFIVKGQASETGISDPNNIEFFIQTLYTPTTITNALCAGPAFAKEVNLMVYKI